MDEGIGPTVGERITLLRGSRLTMNALAAVSGVSVDYLRKLEGNRRHTLAISSFHRIARALDVDITELLSTNRALPDPGEHSGAVAIRRALTPVDDLIGDAPTSEPLTLDKASGAVTHGWRAYWAGRFEQLGSFLPGAIGQLRATVRDARTADRADALDLAAQLHQLAACTLVHLGYTDIAHHALRGAIPTAGPLRAAALRGSLAWVLLRQGRFAESHRLAATTATALAPSGDSELPVWSMYGSLLLGGAAAAARDGDRPGAVELLDEAKRAAGRTGNRTDLEGAFGPDRVLMQTMDVEVVSENYAAALAAAREMPRSPALPVAARARHLADIALTQLRLSHDDAALDALVAMENLAPSWTQYQDLPRHLVRELHHRAAHPRRLTDLAWRIGVVAKS
jgi:transcriptional regulator with XRE-family HTH domain